MDLMTSTMRTVVKGFRMSIVFKRDVHLVDADAEDGRVNDAGVGDVSAITPC